METKITEAVYKTALARIEELLPLVTDDTSPEDRRAIELKIMSDIVIEYEEYHFPIGNPSIYQYRTINHFGSIIDDILRTGNYSSFFARNLNPNH